MRFTINFQLHRERLITQRELPALAGIEYPQKRMLIARKLVEITGPYVQLDMRV